MPIPNTNQYQDLKNGVTKIVTLKSDVYLIDSADKVIAKKYCWSKQTTGYARAVTRIGAKLKTIYLHRLLCATTKQRPHVDHINQDIADCRRINLRACDRAQNLQNQKRRADNSTGFKGVGLHAPSGKYRARVTVRGQKIHIGLFDKPEAAAIAATRWRQKLHKEFARHA